MLRPRRGLEGGDARFQIREHGGQVGGGAGWCAITNYPLGTGAVVEPNEKLGRIWIEPEITGGRRGWRIGAEKDRGARCSCSSNYPLCTRAIVIPNEQFGRIGVEPEVAGGRADGGGGARVDGGA